MSGGSPDLDKAQEKAVRARGNLVVEAGAGSGKTAVLAARYLRLVKEDNLELESILALTFTRKAAGEMRARIRRALLEDDDPRLRSQAESFERAEIHTFDGFCARVARSACRRWGLDPDFIADEEAAARLTGQEAFAFALERRQAPVFRAIVAANGFEALLHDVLGLAAGRMSPAAPLDFSGMAARHRGLLLDMAGRGLPELEGLRRMVLDYQGNKAADSIAGLTAVLSPRLPALPEGHAELAAIVEAVMGTAARMGEPLKSALKAFKEEKGPGSFMLSALAGLGRLPMYAELYALLGEFQERILAAKRAAGILGFRDVAVMARQALLEDLELRDFFKARFRALMVDEFQDDDTLQKDILFLLAERRGLSSPGVPTADGLEEDKLFFVGDEKQSIYRFRGADVSVFRGLSRELVRPGRESPGQDVDLALDRNYRSDPALVDFFNALFPLVMADAQADWEARYRPAVPALPRGPAEPVILLEMEAEGVPGPSEAGVEAEADAETGAGEGIDDEAGEWLSPEESQAWAIAEFIRSSVEGREPLMVRDGREGGRRPAGYGDFAVLLRSVNLQAPFERFFRLLGLPYAAQDLCAFWSEAPANDLLAALRCAVYPGDRNALAAFLRSPFCRLGDDTIARILLGGLVPDEWERAAQGGDEGGKAEGVMAEIEKAARARGIVLSLRAMADRRPLPDILSWLWHENGYADFISRRPRNRAFAEYFDYVFALAARAQEEGAGMAGFISALEDLGREEGSLRDIDPPRRSAGGIRLMTVHKAKGLEFPVVILPSLGYQGLRGGQRGAAAWWEDVLVTRLERKADEGADPFLLLSGEREKSMALAELKRLLYVACTRAESRLVLAAYPGRGAFPEMSFGGQLAGPLSDPALAAMVERRAYPRRGIDEYLGLCRSSEQAMRKPEDVEAGLASARVEVLAAPRRELAVTALNAAYAASLPIARPGDAPAAASLDADAADEASGPAFGTLVHEIIRTGLAAGGEAAALEALPLSAEAQAALDLLPEGSRALPEARSLAAGFLASPLAKRALSSGSMRLETPFLYRIDTPGGPILARGAIDLFFIEGGECVVVDYKTDLERRPDRYRLQLSIYMEAARELCGAAGASGILAWLRAGGPETLPSLPEPRALAAALLAKRPDLVYTGPRHE
jgi:ATP-dependent helicase/nuclease subunit A